MDVYYLDKKYLCIFFPTTLSGPMWLWYKILPMESIHDFNQLKEESISYFIQQRRYTTDAQAIFGCRKHEDESLSAFGYHFNKATINTRGRADYMVIVAFTYGLRPRVFFKKLIGNRQNQEKTRWKEFSDT